MEQYEEVEVSIREAKKMVELGNALQRLEKNRDFKKVIIDNYLREEAIRLVHLRGDPNMQDEESQKVIFQLMDGITGLTQYCNKLRHQSYLAEKAIEDGESVLEDMRNEEGEAEA